MNENGIQVIAKISILVVMLQSVKLIMIIVTVNSLVSYNKDISNTTLSLYSDNNDTNKSYTDLKIENGRHFGGLIRGYHHLANDTGRTIVCNKW